MHRLSRAMAVVEGEIFFNFIYIIYHITTPNTYIKIYIGPWEQMYALTGTR